MDGIQSISLFGLAQQACIDREWLTGLKFLTLLLSTSSDADNNIGNGVTGHRSNRWSDDKHLTNLLSFILTHLLDDDKFHYLPESEVIKLLQLIHRHYCDDTDIMLLTSNIYFCGGFQEKALETVEKVVGLNHHDARVLETFENICCHVVDRWHFIMLNDLSRNAAYHSALHEVLNSSQQPTRSTVLDVGCGTGILSYLASKWSENVYAVDGSSLMCKMARKTFEECHVDEEHKIHVINKMSKELTLSVEIPSRVDVLVTEIFDAGFFGEGILSTLAHAWKELLKSDGVAKSIVIPNRATLHVEVIESTDIWNESIVNNWSGCLKTGNLHIASRVGLLESEPYTSIHLNRLPSGVKYLTSSKPFLQVDLNDPKHVVEINERLQNNLSLEVTEEGFMDALVVWFELQLSDSIHLSTHMETGSCWEQAVFPVSVVRLTKTSLSQKDLLPRLIVCPGDKISASYAVTDDRLSMSVTTVTRPSMSSSLVIDKRQGFPSTHVLLPQPLAWCTHNVYCLTDWEIKMLNDRAYQEILHEAVKHYAPKDKTINTQFVHVNDGFSSLCLQALKFGFHNVQALMPEDFQKALLWKLVQINELDIGRIKIIDDVSELQSDETTRDSASESSASFCGGVPDTAEDELCVTLLEVVDHTGRLVENWIEKLDCVKDYLSSFRTSHVLPEKIDILGMFIDSDCLMTQNRVVSNDNLLGFPVKDYLNNYSTKNHPDICLSTLKHSKLTSAFKMFTLDFVEEFSSVSSRETNVLKNQDVTFKIPVTADGKVDALVYWFDLHLSPSLHLSTLDTGHHWNQACVILDQGEVKSGQELNVRASLHNSTIFVSFLE